MATKATSAAARAQALARAKAAQAHKQQLALQRAQLGQPALVSPYDGSNPYGFPATGPVATDPTGSLTGTGRPQVNATNQSALAPNGDVNQNVTNENNYYNIIMPSSPFGRFFHGTGLGGVGGWGGYGQQPTIDPATGAYYVQRESGVLGWLKRLVRGY